MIRYGNELRCSTSFALMFYSNAYCSTMIMCPSIGCHQLVYPWLHSAAMHKWYFSHKILSAPIEKHNIRDAEFARPKKNHRLPNENEMAGAFFSGAQLVARVFVDFLMCIKKIVRMENGGGCKNRPRVHKVKMIFYWNVCRLNGPTKYIYSCCADSIRM